MFQRLTDKASAFAGLLDTKARLVARDLERAGGFLVAYCGAAVCGILGLCLVVAALVIVLAAEVGTAAALAIVGAVAVLMGMIVLAVVRREARRIHRPSRTELECRAAVLRDRLVSNPRSKPSAAPHPLSGVVEKLAETITEDLRVLGSGAFAALALLGPRRALRLAANAATVASIAASVSSLLRELAPPAGSPHAESNGSSPRPGVVPDPSAPAPAACAPETEAL